MVLFCIGIGEFLTFGATVLMILANIGQLTNNVVSRHIRYVSLTTDGLQSSLRANANGATIDNIYASNQAAPELQGNGIKNEYQWGLYTFCAGQGTSGPRSCADSSIGFRFEPAQVLGQDIGSNYNSTLTSLIGDQTFTDSSYLGRYSHAASYIILIGTILAGLAFLTGFLAHRFAFLLAALLSLGAAALLAVGAAILTAIYYKAIHSLPDNLGLDVNYGNALWFTWASFAACALAFIPYVIGCCTGRSNKY